MRFEKFVCIIGALIFLFPGMYAQTSWNSKWVSVGQNDSLIYHPDKKGNIIPDYSRVGYKEGKEPPQLQVTLELQPQAGDNKNHIQEAIDILAARALDQNGFRGCLLLKKGIYKVSDQININASGIVIRGEGNDEQGTVLIATGKKKYNLFNIKGSGSSTEISGTRNPINMPFVPVGTKKIIVKKTDSYQVGEDIIVYRPATDQWISDIKMDQIEQRSGGKKIVQWSVENHNLSYERRIDHIDGDTLFIDNPIVMEMEDKYGGGYIYKFKHNGRIHQCGIENLMMKSEYASETDENHGWNAIKLDNAADCWVKNIVAKHFGYSAVNIGTTSRNISVLNSKCLEAKSKIMGGRRYSFNCDGQLNLIKNCETTEGRHDYVTGFGVCGPNVFAQCKATNTHADIGPHHRWATGTLYDQITTDRAIKVQDRGNYGTGHGWAGANQIFWNCTANEICVQSPWTSGKNYAIACVGKKINGRHPDRPDGEWEGLNRNGIAPASLYEAQVKDRLNSSIPVYTKIDMQKYHLNVMHTK